MSRKRQPLRIDRDATAACGFKDKRSHVTLDGRHLYYGEDAELARYYAWCIWDGLCAICGLPANDWEIDWEHIASKGLHARDDHPRNRQFSHHACHMKAHNREPLWSKAHTPDCPMSKPLGLDGATCNCGLFRRVFGAKENTNA